MHTINNMVSNSVGGLSAGAGMAIARACGLTLLETADAGPVPIELVAVTVNVYTLPFVNPVTIQGELIQSVVIPPGELVTL